MTRLTLRAFGPPNPIECAVNVNATLVFFLAARDGTVFAMFAMTLVRLSQRGATVSIIMRLSTGVINNGGSR
jgi:hypothetical protein